MQSFFFPALLVFQLCMASQHEMLKSLVVGGALPSLVVEPPAANKIKKAADAFSPKEGVELSNCFCDNVHIHLITKDTNK